MLSLVLILCVIVIFFAIRKKKKYLTSIGLFVSFCIFSSVFPMFVVVNQNDTGYLQRQIDTLTTVNLNMEDWIETLENSLSDNPPLLNHLKDYINKEIDSNNAEIIRCKNLQENRVEKYRWLLYFG